MTYEVFFNKASGAKVMQPVLSRENYLALRGSEKQRRTLKAVREGDEEQKKNLLQMNYSCLPNDDGTLKGTTRMSSTVGMDIDHIPTGEMESIKQRILAKKEELGLLMLERSARGQGYHLVFRRKPGMDQEENLRWASTTLDVDYDRGAKDITRVFFTTTADPEELIYLDDEIFKQEEAVEPPHCVCKHNCAGCSHCHGRATTPIKSFPMEYNGFHYSEIIAKYWELFNEGKEPVRGNRDTLTFQLACDLRHICDHNPEWLDQVIPCYDGFPTEDKRKKIENALEAKIQEGMPYRLNQVLKALKAQNGLKACGGTMKTPPPMPHKLPAQIQLLTCKVPAIYKPAVASAVFPALAAHMHGVKFRYIDNVTHEPTLMNVLIGLQGCGKSCIKKPIEFITEDIRQRDFPSRQRETEWKQKNPTAKQKKDPHPTDICIQYLSNNLTDAVFNQRLIDANNNGERFLYTIVDELDGLNKVTSSGKTDEVALLIREAFDNSLAGQERVSADSVSGMAPLRWNFNAATTPLNAKKFFEKGLISDGTLSRLDISTIIIPEESSEMPVMGIYDERFAQQLKPYIERLEAANGLIKCPQADRLAKELSQENIGIAKLYDSRAYKIFSHRSNVIAWLKAMVLYVANNCHWNKEIQEFVSWSERYDLWCKMLYFGKQLEAEEEHNLAIQKHSAPQNLLNLLPDQFNKEEYLQMRRKQGKTDDGASCLSMWKKRGYIYSDVATGLFCKTEEYKLKYGGQQ